MRVFDQSQIGEELKSTSDLGVSLVEPLLESIFCLLFDDLLATHSTFLRSSGYAPEEQLAKVLCSRGNVVDLASYTTAE